MTLYTTIIKLNNLISHIESVTKHISKSHKFNDQIYIGKDFSKQDMINQLNHYYNELCELRDILNDFNKVLDGPPR